MLDMIHKQFYQMPFKKLMRKVDHPQNNTNDETPGAQKIPGSDDEYFDALIWQEVIDEIDEGVAAGHIGPSAEHFDEMRLARAIIDNDAAYEKSLLAGCTYSADGSRVYFHPGPPEPGPHSIGLSADDISRQLKAAMDHINNTRKSVVRKVKNIDFVPDIPTPLNQGLKTILATFSAEDMSSFGDILQSEGYFWISKAIEAAFATKVQYAFIINSIMIRYANQIFLRDGPFSKFSTMIMTAFERLVSVIGGYFHASDLTDQQKKSPYSYDENGIQTQGIADDAASFFSNFATQLTSLLKYMSQQNVLCDLIRIVAIALLGSFTFAFGDREAFSWENVEMIVRRAMRVCTEGTIGSLTRVLMAVYGIFKDFLTGGTTSDFSDFLKNNTQQALMIELSIKLRAGIAAWGSLTVDQQGALMEDWIVYEAYCNETLGRTRGWASGKRILDAKTLAAFQTNYYTFSAWAQPINMGSLRKQPLCVAFIGPSAMGKTTVMDYVNQMILGHVGVTNFTAATFNVSAEGDHMDGATNGKKTFILDDVGTKHPNLTANSGGDQQLAILVRLLNNIPYFPVMAALEDKGVVCCTPLLVLISSNLPTLGIEHSYVNPTIVERRVGIWVTLKVRPEFATKTGVLDSAKMKAWSVANPGKVADAWVFSVTIKSAAAGDDGKMYTNNEELEDMSTPAFLKFIMDEYIAHDLTQTNVLAQSQSKYDFSHVTEHGDSKPDPSLVLDYPKPVESDRGGRTYASLLKRPENTNKRSRRVSPKGQHRSPEGFHRQCGEDYLDYDYACIPPRPKSSFWIPIFGALGVVVAYLSTRDWTTTVSATIAAIQDVHRVAELAGYASGRYATAMRWVTAGIDAMVKLARLLTPFVAAATAAVGLYYFTKMVSSKPTDGVINQGGNATKRKQVERDEPTADDILLMTTLGGRPPPHDISLAPGAYKVVSQVKTDVMMHDRTFCGEYAKPGQPVTCKAGDLMLPQKHVAVPQGGTLPTMFAHNVAAEGEKFKGGMLGEWLPHPNDKVSSYADGMPQYKAESGKFKMPIHILSQTSLSVKGFDMVSFVKSNMVDLTFRSAPYCELGIAGALVGMESNTTMVFKGKGLFYRGKELITSQHYLPPFHPERSSNPIWKDGWTLTITGASDTGSDVVMTADSILKGGNLIRLKYKDCVRLLAKKARCYKNISSYFARRTLPGNVMEGGFVTSAQKDHDHSSEYFAKVIGVNQYLPPEMPVGLCTDDGVSPAGMITETTVDRMENQGWLVHTKAWMDVTTYQGQCGTPVLTCNNGIWNAIVGIHTGVMRINSKVKVITPVCQEDLFEGAFGVIAPGEPPVSVPNGSTLQDAIDMRWDLMNNPKWNGPQVDPNLHVQFMPPVKPTQWEQSNLDWVTSLTGYVPNPDSFSSFGARDGISGNLASEFRESPLRQAFAEADWTGLPGPLTSDKCVPNINRRKRNQACAQNLGQIMAQMSYNEVLADEIMEAADCLLDSIIRHDEDRQITSHLFPYDMHHTINGHRMENGNVAKAATPLNYSTSAGLPFSETAPVSSKVPWFIIDADGNRHMGEDLASAFHALKELMANTGPNDPKPKVIFKVALKDEVLSEAKLEAGKIRFILVCPVHATLLTRQMLLCLCRAMALNPFVFGACVGVDATSAQWKQLFDFLTEHGALTFDGDYQGFDKALIQEITDAIKYVILELLKRSGNYDGESLNIVRNLLGALLSPVVDVFGILYFFRSLNSSGNPLTTQFNCIANMLLIWLAFLRRVKKNTGDKFDIRRARELFRAIIRAITYGDDNVISSRRPKLFSCSIMAEELKDIIRYTDAQKGDVTRDFTPSEELVFLGRKMKGAPKLEFKRIAKMLTHYRRYRGVDFATVIGPIYRNVLMETYFHGKGVFDAMHKIMVNVLSAHYNIPGEVVIQIYLSSGSDPLDYQFFDDWYQAKANSDALIDPRFDEAKLFSVEEKLACEWYDTASGEQVDY